MTIFFFFSVVSSLFSKCRFSYFILHDDYLMAKKVFDFEGGIWDGYIWPEFDLPSAVS